MVRVLKKANILMKDLFRQDFLEYIGQTVPENCYQSVIVRGKHEIAVFK